MYIYVDGTSVSIYVSDNGTRIFNSYLVDDTRIFHLTLKIPGFRMFFKSFSC